MVNDDDIGRMEVVTGVEFDVVEVVVVALSSLLIGVSLGFIINSGTKWFADATYS